MFQQLTFSGLFSLCDVPTAPILGFSKGAKIQDNISIGQMTSSSAKMRISVLTSGIARTIWRRLFAFAIDSTRIRGSILVQKLSNRSWFFLTVTTMISRGLQSRHFRRVCSKSSPLLPSIVGNMTVMSSDV